MPSTKKKDKNSLQEEDTVVAILEKTIKIMIDQTSSRMLHKVKVTKIN
jgi:hypothetical protein